MKFHYETYNGNILCCPSGHRGYASGKIGGYIRGKTKDVNKVTCKRCINKLIKMGFELRDGE